MRRTVPAEALTALILEVFRLNGRLLSAGDTLTRPSGQTSARWQVLGALDEGARTVAEIGRSMGLTRQSVQRTADLLEADGLLSYAANPAHQRAKLALLTPRGRATLDVITRRQIEWVNTVAHRLDEADLRRATRALQHVRAAVDALAAPMNRDAGRQARRHLGSPRRRRTAGSKRRGS